MIDKAKEATRNVLADQIERAKYFVDDKVGDRAKKLND